MVPIAGRGPVEDTDPDPAGGESIERPRLRFGLPADRRAVDQHAHLDAAFVGRDERLGRWLGVKGVAREVEAVVRFSERVDRHLR